MLVNRKFKEKTVNFLLDIPEILTGKKNIDLSNFSNDDLNRMNNIAFQQIIVPFFYNVYEKYSPYSLKKEFLIEKEKINKRIKNQLDLLKKIKYEFDKNNIEFVIIKGFVLSKYIYSDYTTRNFSDIDILIDYTKIKKANKLMKKMGFKNELNDAIFNNLNNLDCYEIKYRYPIINENGVESEKFEHKLSVEIKTSTSAIRNLDLINKFKNNKIKILINELEFNTFNINDTFILLILNIYGNFQLEFAKAKFRDIFDIYFFMEYYEDQLNWEYIYFICNKFKITHKFYFVFNLINAIYNNRFNQEILEVFSLENNLYEKNIYQNYKHGFIRDWNFDFIDIMLGGRKRRCEELFYQDSLKSYTSNNINFENKIYIKSLEDSDIDFEEDNKLMGLKSSANGLEYVYKFNHDENYIYFELDFKKLNNNMKTILVLFDINREAPRKTIEFYLYDGMIISKNTSENFKYEEISSSKNSILISIKKSQIDVLKNCGKLLSYYIYSIRTYNKTDFAIIDELHTFDYNNPHLLYLDSNFKRILW